MKNEKAVRFLRNNWLVLLIVLQPVLDILAFWTRNPDATLAGYVRLLVMIVFPIYLLCTLREKRERLRLLLALGLTGGICLLHILNIMRIGPESLVYELSYTAKTAQMPILAICFVFSIKNDQTRNQAYWGLCFAAAITGLALGLSILTGTANVTYGEGLGVSGWVIDDNRTANSTILVVLAAFAVFCAVKSDKKAVNVLVPVLSALCLILNGTMTCYLSIFLIDLGFAVFLPLEKRVRGCQINRLAVLVLIVTAILSAAAFRFTPKYKIRQSQESYAVKTQSDLAENLEKAGYDPALVTKETVLNDPLVHEIYADFYYDCLWYLSPDMFDRFSIDEIMEQYNYTTDGGELIDTRLVKSNYAALLWKHSDFATKLFGFDISTAWLKGRVDLENDWPAIFYYYGYVGFGAYVGFILYFFWRILRRLRYDFCSAFTADNFILLVTLVLLIGIAQYSGAVLRRPNVSVYFSLILGLIYYQTRTDAGPRVNSWRGEWI